MIKIEGGVIELYGSASEILTDLQFIIMALRTKLPDELIRLATENGFKENLKNDDEMLKNLLYQAALKLKEDENK